MNDSEFDDQDLALLNAARKASDEEGKTQATPEVEGDKTTEKQAATTASEQTAQVEAVDATAQTQAVTTEAQPAQQERTGGDLRAALRASRRSESRSRHEAERLRQENEELRASQVTKSDDLVDPELLDSIETDFPQVAGVFKALVNKVGELSKGQAKPQPAKQEEPEFTPQVLPADLQAVVDEIPDLLDWQLNPDQTNFELAKQADAMLLRSPKWKGANESDRLAEVVRVVKEQTAPVASSQTTTAKTATTTAADAAAVVAAAAQSTPVGIGDLRGSATPSKTEPDFNRMSDDQIMASLPR